MPHTSHPSPETDDIIKLLSDLILGKHVLCKTLFAQYIKEADPSMPFVPLQETTEFLNWMELVDEEEYQDLASWVKIKNAVNAFMACSERMYKLHRSGKHELAIELLDTVYEDVSRDLQKALYAFYKDIN